LTSSIAVAVRPGAVTASGAVRTGRVEGHELTSHLHAAIGVGVDDHAQRAVEAAALLRGEVVQLLQGKEFVSRQEGVPVALELGDAPGAPSEIL
jgi:hypothetical protein